MRLFAYNLAIDLMVTGYTVFDESLNKIFPLSTEIVYSSPFLSIIFSNEVMPLNLK